MNTLDAIRAVALLEAAKGVVTPRAGFAALSLVHHAVQSVDELAPSSRDRVPTATVALAINLLVCGVMIRALRQRRGGVAGYDH